jgi:sarcosine oxidase subunit beta
VYCAEDGYFDRPLAVVHGFAEAAVRLGATVEEADVAAVEPDGSGWAVVERNGRRRLCDQVVVSAGYDSPAILAGLGVEIPIRKEARHLFYSSPIRQRLLEPLVVSPDQHFAAKQLADGCVLASDLSAEGDASEELAAWHQRVRTSIRTLLPILEFVEFPVHVEGYYDLTPDSQPILGSVPDRPGVWIAAGMSGRGFMIAPAVGRLLADAIEGAAQDDLLDALSLRRFQRQNLHSEPQVV